MQNRTDLALELKEEKNIGSAQSGIIVKTRIDTTNHIIVSSHLQKALPLLCNQSSCPYPAPHLFTLRFPVSCRKILYLFYNHSILSRKHWCKVFRISAEESAGFLHDLTHDQFCFLISFRFKCHKKNRFHLMFCCKRSL